MLRITDFLGSFCLSNTDLIGFSDTDLLLAAGGGGAVPAGPRADGGAGQAAIRGDQVPDDDHAAAAPVQVGVVLSAQYSAVVSNTLHRSPDPAKVCAQLEAAVCDLEDAVAGISGARCGDRRAGLRQRMAALAGVAILGEGYRMLLNTCLKMPFVK